MNVTKNLLTNKHLMLWHKNSNNLLYSDELIVALLYDINYKVLNLISKWSEQLSTLYYDTIDFIFFY